MAVSQPLMRTRSVMGNVLALSDIGLALVQLNLNVKF